MNLNLNCGNFESELIVRKPLLDGIQYQFRFKNGYGASVVKHMGSYGHEVDLWELAVIKFNSENNGDWDLVYDTEITNDVLGYLDDDEVLDILSDIRDLS